MKIEFKGNLLCFRPTWILEDDKIIVGKKEYQLNKMKKVNLFIPQTHGLSPYISFIYDDNNELIIINFSRKEPDFSNAKEAFQYINLKIKEYEEDEQRRIKEEKERRKQKRNEELEKKRQKEIEEKRQAKERKTKEEIDKWLKLELEAKKAREELELNIIKIKDVKTFEEKLEREIELRQVEEEKSRLLRIELEAERLRKRNEIQLNLAKIKDVKPLDDNDSMKLEGDIDYSKNNLLTLVGMVTSEIKFSHEIYGEKFYTFDLSIPRLNGGVDIIPITIGKNLISDEKLKKYEKILVKSQFSSYNSYENERNKIVLTVLAKEIKNCQEEETKNEVELIGFVCKKPIYRQTPFGREIADVLLAVNRAYNKSDYISCIAWGRNARFCQYIEVGTEVKLIGKVQLREYEKKYEDGTSEKRVDYEVSIVSLEVIN